MKSLLPVLVVPALILLIPLLAMVFKADGWAWNAGSFVIAWVLMAGVGLAYKLVTRRNAGGLYRAATAVGLGTGFLLLWVNGAVGLIGSEDNPANLLYGGVLVLGAIGAVFARLEPAGMAAALVVVALAQFAVPLIALLFWPGDFRPGVTQVIVLNFCFVLLFLGSALLFRQAGRRQRV